MMSVKQKALKILSSWYISMSSLTLDHVTLKSIGGYQLLTKYQCTKFDICQAKYSQDIERTIFSYVQYDPWPCHLKINRGHLLLMMYQCTKFDVCQAKGSQDIEWTVFSYVQYDPWPCNLQIISNDLPVYQVWCLSITQFSRYWVVSIFLCPV